MIGASFLLEGVFSYLFLKNFVTADTYTTKEGICLNIIGVLSVCWIITVFYANKYADSALVTYIMNLELLIIYLLL